jgi:hypothetical protein
MVTPLPGANNAAIASLRASGAAEADPHVNIPGPPSTSQTASRDQTFEGIFFTKQVIRGFAATTFDASRAGDRTQIGSLSRVL